MALSEHTVVHGVTSADSAVDAWAKDVLEGAWAIVLYTENGAHKTAVAIDSLGGRTVKVAHGSVVRVDEAAESIVIKTTAGGEDTFELAGYVVVDAEPRSRAWRHRDLSCNRERRRGGDLVFRTGRKEDRGCREAYLSVPVRGLVGGYPTGHQPDGPSSAAVR